MIFAPQLCFLPNIMSCLISDAVIISFDENEIYVVTLMNVEGASQDSKNSSFAYGSRRNYFNSMAQKYRWLINEPEKLVSISEYDTYLEVRIASLPFNIFYFGRFLTQLLLKEK